MGGLGEVAAGWERALGVGYMVSRRHVTNRSKQIQAKGHMMRRAAGAKLLDEMRSTLT